MRSLLIQASSVEKAIGKAWISAGMPTSFTIKVLDFGEKGFLGMTKKSSIVSIMYEPQRQTAVSKHKQTQPQRRQTGPTKQVKPNEAPKKDRVFWSDDLVNDITTWIKEAAKIIGITTSISTHVNKKTLTLKFNDFVLSNQDEERLLFSGLASLVMQFLKKKHKKKYQGYQLIITSKRFVKKQT